ncbi:hypothetical protein [Variovorax sp. RA8]|uniref:hypothetical protein n=1 Tax=Variovorax sp. (strain JCM 16519 / RA8) TaxID=662548 RepID=UPI001319313C|nr:hypothetical protein [Variovorax sp. RA8]VTU44927.1 hypothetical protein RA8P2_00363 [Variovorax sp. RA8]
MNRLSTSSQRYGGAALRFPPAGSNQNRPLSEASASLPGGQPFIGWARHAPAGSASHEVSSRGDSRFSALFARLKDGRTIEEAWQLDCKGYRTLGNDWRLGKGKQPLRAIDQWGEYLGLWRTWAAENPQAMAELGALAQGRFLTDMFASSPNSQARALATLLAEANGWRLAEPSGGTGARPSAQVQGQPGLFSPTPAPGGAPVA